MKTILVVDDNPEITELLEVRLKMNGYQVITAANGVQAYAMAMDQKPDLIVLDVMMPMMDGHAFIKEIKWRPELKNIPILILTARSETKDLFGEMGIVNFVSKPFNSQKLLDNIEVCLQN